MKSLFSTPFPRPQLKTYLGIAAGVGAIVIFILCVFQPFGTSGFVHEYKYAILAGYGITVFLALALYFTLSLRIINKNRLDHWNVVWECMDIMVAVILSFVACYIYASLILGFRFGWIDFLRFVAICTSVAIFPVSLFFMWMLSRYQGLKRSTIAINAQGHKRTVQLRGTTKNDFLEIEEDQILFIKADDNYVVIHVDQEASKNRFMIRSTLANMMRQLASNKFRICHRSYIVNTARIAGHEGNKNNTKLILEGTDRKIPVSRTLVDEIRNIA